MHFIQSGVFRQKKCEEIHIEAYDSIVALNNDTEMYVCMLFFVAWHARTILNLVTEIMANISTNIAKLCIMPI